MTALARARSEVVAPALAAAGASGFWLLGLEPGASALLTVAAAAVLAAVAWALVDLERFALFAVFAAMVFPHALVRPAGALVAAADLLLVVALSCWLVRRSLGIVPRADLRNPILLPAVLFAGVTGASAVWSSDLGATAKATVQIVEIVVVVPLLFASLPTSLTRIRQAFAVYLALTAGLAVAMALPFAERAAAGDISPQYLGGFHKNTVGSFLAIGVVIAYVLSLERRRSRRSRALLAGVAVVELAGLCATISRGALLGCFVAVVVATVLLGRARVRTAALVALVGAAFLLAIQAPLSAEVRSTGGYETTEVRLLSYARGSDKILENPFLGSGAGTYGDWVQQLGCALADPNNIFLHT